MRRFNMACVKTLDVHNWQAGLPYMDVADYLSKLDAPKVTFPYIRDAVRLYNSKTNPDIKKWLEDYKLPINVVMALIIKSGIQYNVNGMLEFIDRFEDTKEFISSDFIRSNDIKIFETDLIWDMIYDGIQLVKKSDIIMASELDNFIQFIEQVYEVFNKNNIRYFNMT
jgi:hypothetical protein